MGTRSPTSRSLSTTPPRRVAIEKPPVVRQGGEALDGRFDDAERLGNGFVLVRQHELAVRPNDLRGGHATGPDELNGLVRTVSRASRPSGSRQQSLVGEEGPKVVFRFRPLDAKGEALVLFALPDRNAFVARRTGSVLDIDRDLVVPVGGDAVDSVRLDANRTVGRARDFGRCHEVAEAVRLQADRVGQPVVREEVRHVERFGPSSESRTGIPLALVAPFSPAARDGRKHVRVARRPEQLDALQDRRLAAVVPPDEQVDAAESFHPERVEAAVALNPYRRIQRTLREIAGSSSMTRPTLHAAARQCLDRRWRAGVRPDAADVVSGPRS